MLILLSVDSVYLIRQSAPAGLETAPHGLVRACSGLRREALRLAARLPRGMVEQARMLGITALLSPGTGQTASTSRREGTCFMASQRGVSPSNNSSVDVLNIYRR